VVIRALALKRLTPSHTSAGLGSTLLAWPTLLLFYLTHALFPSRLSVFSSLVPVMLRHGLKATLMSHYSRGEIVYAKGDMQGAMREYRLELLDNPAIDPRRRRRPSEGCRGRGAIGRVL
jgi:hypothetical protein